jgi:protein-disulfide isomerase
VKHTHLIVGAACAFLFGMGIMYTADRGAHSPAATAAPDPAAGALADAPRVVNPGAVKVELFVMSQCPYGVQAEAAFEEVVQKMGADIDLKVEFIGKGGAGGELTSMHGPKEVMGDLLQVCAQKHTGKWFEFIQCQNKDWKNIDTGWEACAKAVGASAEKIGACAKGPEGRELLAASFKRADDKDVSGSPTIHIAGKDYEGSRRPKDIMRAICAAYQGEQPAVCGEIPPQPKVNVTILSDKRCGQDCDTEGLQGQIGGTVGAPVITTVDYESPEGKKLFDKIKPAKLPAVVFDKTLADDEEASQNLAKALMDRGDLKIATVGDWNPACADDGGCKLDECKDRLQCRAEEPKKLEVFVMSQCPFGVKGLDAMKEVLANFDKAGEKLDFVIHYIGDGDASGLKSMHGQPEVDEDIRAVCAIKNYDKNRKYLDYIWCRNKDYKSADWQTCTGDATGIDAAVISKCFDGEGKDLLAKSFAASEAAGFGASPTWLVNGKFKFSGIDAETIKTNVCAHNKMKGCENKLSGQAPAASNGGGQPAPGCGE